MTRDILCTLGPASMHGSVIKRLQEVGVTIFRINLSHTKLEQVEPVIRFIQSHTKLPICIDSEGAQIRTGLFVEGSVTVRGNTIITVHRKLVPGDSTNMNFVPASIIDSFEIGDFLSIDFNSVLVQVLGLYEDRVEMRVITGGQVGSNKAITLERQIDMPALSEKDISAMHIGLRFGIKHFALSFANRASDVEEVRQIVGDDALIISKIECKNGIENLDGIIEKSNAVLIDRGDLSREMPLERIPELQKMIIKRAKASNCVAYVATNLLESMIKEPTPTRAEVNDIHNTLLDGADGLVLAAETAIGKYPIQCASMIVRMIDAFDKSSASNDVASFNSTSLLVPPHGGRLTTSYTTSDKVPDYDTLLTITVPITALMDCEQIAHGVYSPLTGFMGSEATKLVLDEMRLPSGESWSMPILLALDPDIANSLEPGTRIKLTHPNGDAHAVMDVEEVFTLDLDEIAKKWFGTSDQAHPGIARIKAEGNTFIAGPVTLTQRLSSEFQHYALLPEQSRFIFDHQGWSRIVGFHGRNPAHRAHTFIQLQALEKTGADGLFINPVIGPQKSGDFLAEYVLKSYQMMLEFNLYPQGRVLLGSFSTYPRFCGPREAVFTAICRQNMGCSHFIIGRDHAGVGNYYGPTDAIKMFEKLSDIKIEPVFFDAVFYDVADKILKEGAPGPDDQTISGTAVRDAIRDGKHVPDWMMWTPLQDMLLSERAAGKDLIAK